MRAQGFSLIEIMIVVAIIGILVTLAYPSMERYLVSSRQTEAKTNLMAIYTAQKIYQASNKSFATQLDELGVSVKETTLYRFSLQSDGKSFLATAEGNIDNDETSDVWTINESKELLNTTNDVLD